MSTTKKSMLSSTQAIFWGLLHELPNNAPPCLKQALIKAHRQLSEYYTQFDESLYYIWSSRESTLCYFLALTEYDWIILQCLTPRSHMKVWWLIGPMIWQCNIMSTTQRINCGNITKITMQLKFPHKFPSLTLLQHPRTHPRKSNLQPDTRSGHQ